MKHPVLFAIIITIGFLESYKLAWLIRRWLLKENEDD